MQCYIPSLERPYRVAVLICNAIRRCFLSALRPRWRVQQTLRALASIESLQGRVFVRRGPHIIPVFLSLNPGQLFDSEVRIKVILRLDTAAAFSNAIRALAWIPKLAEVEIRGDGPTELNIHDLAALQKLQVLKLPNSGIAPDTVLNLAKRMPNTVVV